MPEHVTDAYYNDIAPFCIDILRKHITAGDLPAGEASLNDIRTVDPAPLQGFRQWHLFAGIGGMPYGLRLGGWPDDAEILTAGFPCQPVSVAGKRCAQADDRWLWPEVDRFIRLLRPRVVLLENVPGLLIRGMGDVLRDLAASGYDASWRVLAAADVGAPHRRERVWIVAYPQERSEWAGLRAHRTDGLGRRRSGDCVGADVMAHAESLSGQVRPPAGERPGRSASGGDVADPHRQWKLQSPGCQPYKRRRTGDGGRQWAVEPDVGRVADGIPHRVDRLKALGNAVVPQCVAALVPWIREETGL